ncbi:hypothetical protein WN51_03430 [Melipona quadrifasciata]|uniref:Uncharacterized protein n=1 Tax=Melipona quadrifasciata TaxID=166423 RepID=A0A0N0BKV4_9HYME|nr:hypothetical protein WN51_03430 [Melipona quadrifasciata]
MSSIVNFRKGEALLNEPETNRFSLRNRFKVLPQPLVLPQRLFAPVFPTRDPESLHTCNCNKVKQQNHAKAVCPLLQTTNKKIRRSIVTRVHEL